jgi:hypothetical protein
MAPWALVPSRSVAKDILNDAALNYCESALEDVVNEY